MSSFRPSRNLVVVQGYPPRLGRKRGGEKGMPILGSYYYFSQCCNYCQKLITGQSAESRSKARKDHWYKMREHGRLYHPKEIEDNPQTGRQSVLNYKKNEEKKGAGSRENGSR